jgi:hypothetical protein
LDLSLSLQSDAGVAVRLHQTGPGRRPLHGLGSDDSRHGDALPSHPPEADRPRRSAPQERHPDLSTSGVVGCVSRTGTVHVGNSHVDASNAAIIMLAIEALRRPQGHFVRSTLNRVVASRKRFRFRFRERKSTKKFLSPEYWCYSKRAGCTTSFSGSRKLLNPTPTSR